MHGGISELTQDTCKLCCIWPNCSSCSLFQTIKYAITSSPGISTQTRTGGRSPKNLTYSAFSGANSPKSLTKRPTFRIYVKLTCSLRWFMMSKSYCFGVIFLMSSAVREGFIIDTERVIFSFTKDFWF